MTFGHPSRSQISAVEGASGQRTYAEDDLQ